MSRHYTIYDARISAGRLSTVTSFLDDNPRGTTVHLHAVTYDIPRSASHLRFAGELPRDRPHMTSEKSGL